MLFWNKCLVENEIPKAVALWLNNLQGGWWACYKGRFLATSRGFQVSGSFFYFPDMNLTWGYFSNYILNPTALQRRVALKATFCLFGWVSVAGFMCRCVFSGEKVAEKRETRKKRICLYPQSKSEERKSHVATGGWPWLGDQFEMRFQRLAASVRFVLTNTLQCILKIREVRDIKLDN